MLGWPIIPPGPKFPGPGQGLNLEPIVAGDTEITLTPVSFGSVALVFKPISGDTESWLGKGRVTYSRNLTINSIRGGNNYYRFVITVRAIDDLEIPVIKDWLKDCVGGSLDYTDLKGKVWRCIVTNPDTAIVDSGRQHMNNLSLELEGVEGS